MLQNYSVSPCLRILLIDVLLSYDVSILVSSLPDDLLVVIRHLSYHVFVINSGLFDFVLVVMGGLLGFLFHIAFVGLSINTESSYEVFIFHLFHFGQKQEDNSRGHHGDAHDVFSQVVARWIHNAEEKRTNKEVEHSFT